MEAQRILTGNSSTFARPLRLRCAKSCSNGLVRGQKNARYTLGQWHSTSSSARIAPLRASSTESASLEELPEPVRKVSSEQRTAQAKSRLRRLRRKREQVFYQFSAIAATCLVGLLAFGATYLRFSWHLQESGDFPYGEMVATLALVFGGVIGMEMWARYAHEHLWHINEGGWALHKSHHEPRTGPFEANDIFALMNGVPAMGLCLYGFITPNLTGGLCFGAGLGITLFGIMYMFVHDGLVHRRFPVGPIAELPYLKRVAVAHQLHHSEKFGGLPWGMFLGPLEIEAVPGGREELDRLVLAMDQRNASSSSNAL